VRSRRQALEQQVGALLPPGLPRPPAARICTHLLAHLPQWSGMQTLSAGQASLGHESVMQLTSGCPFMHFQGLTVTLCMTAVVAADLREALAPSV
jgi:hypothetical protein